MTTRHTAALAAILAAAALLAGCTATQPPPRPTSTHTARTTPAPTATAAAPPKQTPAPSSQDDALQAAQKAVNSFLVFEFALTADPSLGPHYLDPYVTGPATGDGPGTVQTYEADHLRVEGKPSTFTADMSVSYASEAKETYNGTTTTTPYGNAMLLGCLSNLGTGQRNVSTDGGTPITLKLQSSPYLYQAIYSPSRGTWLIRGFQPATAANGPVPTC